MSQSVRGDSRTTSAGIENNALVFLWRQFRFGSGEQEVNAAENDYGKEHDYGHKIQDTVQKSIIKSS